MQGSTPKNHTSYGRGQSSGDALSAHGAFVLCKKYGSSCRTAGAFELHGLCSEPTGRVRLPIAARHIRRIGSSVDMGFPRCREPDEEVTTISCDRSLWLRTRVSMLVSRLVVAKKYEFCFSARLLVVSSQEVCSCMQRLVSYAY